MCEKCDEMRPREEEMAEYFCELLQDYAEEHSIDVRGILNVLKALHDSLARLLTKQPNPEQIAKMLENKLAYIRGGAAPKSYFDDKVIDTDDLPEDMEEAFNQMIFRMTKKDEVN
jgi:hypothetical protein